MTLISPREQIMRHGQEVPTLATWPASLMGGQTQGKEGAKGAEAVSSAFSRAREKRQRFSQLQVSHPKSLPTCGKRSSGRCRAFPHPEPCLRGRRRGSARPSAPTEKACAGLVLNVIRGIRSQEV